MCSQDRKDKFVFISASQRQFAIILGSACQTFIFGKNILHKIDNLRLKELTGSRCVNESLIMKGCRVKWSPSTRFHLRNSWVEGQLKVSGEAVG